MITAGPSSPGVGAPEYQPASAPLAGTSMVPSGRSPSSIVRTLRSSVGMITRVEL